MTHDSATTDYRYVRTNLSSVCSRSCDESCWVWVPCPDDSASSATAMSWARRNIPRCVPFHLLAVRYLAIEAFDDDRCPFFMYGVIF